jgi:predicted small lipoprotein YifL
MTSIFTSSAGKFTPITTSLSALAMLSALATLATLTACGLSTPQNTTAMSTTPKTSSKVADASWITAQQKHNNSGIQLRYRLMGKPQVGQPLEIQLEFFGVTQDDAGMTMRSDKALSMGDASMRSMQKTNAGYQMALAKTQKTQQSLTITPSAQGMHYIDLQLAQGGRQSMVSIAVPVGDGPFATPTTGEVQTLPSGEKIIVMPSQ